MASSGMVFPLRIGRSSRGSTFLRRLIMRRMRKWQIEARRTRARRGMENIMPQSSNNDGLVLFKLSGPRL